MLGLTRWQARGLGHDVHTLFLQASCRVVVHSMDLDAMNFEARVHTGLTAALRYGCIRL